MILYFGGHFTNIAVHQRPIRQADLNQWAACHPPWIVITLHLCTIPQLVLHLGSNDKKYRIYHWTGEQIEIYSDNPLARDGGGARGGGGGGAREEKAAPGGGAGSRGSSGGTTAH